MSVGWRLTAWKGSLDGAFPLHLLSLQEPVKKRRTFRKFTYRGVDLDQLLDMPTEALMELFHARARRRCVFVYGGHLMFARTRTVHAMRGLGKWADGTSFICMCRNPTKVFIQANVKSSEYLHYRVRAQSPSPINVAIIPGLWHITYGRYGRSKYESHYTVWAVPFSVSVSVSFIL